ncbi:glycoside hydrolase family 3 C-terminal domain-containing protein [Flavobacterium sp. K77]|uniref:glycoside hydrolase family 3 protein n=1 Tax=Flavobacterium sp. K77 TaxID=2910676 RepID=UPI001F2EA897|nr:glycoside hydrolase family 3 N-terminal domain-containing protein [Flavobacterium sp. K77]MCF6139806.1 glycoside hydrolase family 3 C-terminal domain-containing protein [Flavobacterium sp. K77]
MKSKIVILPSLLLLAVGLQAQTKWTETNKNTYKLVANKGGQTLGYSPQSGIKIIQVDGFAFKDLNKNGKLDLYEDWRKPVNERAKDLAAQMTVEQIAGLMLYSRHQAIPAQEAGMFTGTYNGKPFSQSGAKPSALSDQQIAFLTKDNLRHILMTSVASPEIAAQWNNNIQTLVEGIEMGIPANNSSDPRNGANKDAEYNAGSGGAISQWPEELGLAATFDAAITQQFGSIAAQEYRAMGIATALSPQIDLATEPRWNRFVGTFGEDPKLATDMARAYVDGFQTPQKSIANYNGWGHQSVNAMVKHWPSGGPEEAGRDGHFAYGKFAVYPGNNFETHLKPFTEGAFQLNGSTKKASAVMPYYTISFGQDKKYNENVGNGFSKYIITDLLRDKYSYDGVVCTDWLITADEGPKPDVFAGKSWGVESMTVAERHYKVLMAGVDQFGGNNDIKPVLEAYQMGVKEQGETFMRKRFEQSAVRLLLNIFRVGLFENAYLDPNETKAIVGKPEFMKAGYDAQLKSVVLLKNQNKTLPIAKGKTVYVPKRTTPAGINFFGQPSPEKIEYPVNLELIKRYYTVTDDPDKADFAMVFIKSPISNGYSRTDREAGGNGYLPISLQLSDYTAVDARVQSIADGDPVIDPTINNRSYVNKTSKSNSYPDLNTILDTKKAMKDKPVLVAVSISNPMVFSDFEKNVDAILGDFGVQVEALLDIVSGKTEPSGLLPLQMPANMSTVEKQLEDVPHDMIPYQDNVGNVYDFGFGLNWKGPIKDARTAKYSVKK